jgi:glutamate decarboxylase
MHMLEAGRRHVHTKGGTSSITPYSTRYSCQQEIPKLKIPKEGAPADAVHQILKDELDLDGRPNLNLARYVCPFIYFA